MVFRKEQNKNYLPPLFWADYKKALQELFEYIIGNGTGNFKMSVFYPASKLEEKLFINKMSKNSQKTMAILLNSNITDTNNTIVRKATKQTVNLLVDAVTGNMIIDLELYDNESKKIVRAYNALDIWLENFSEKEIGELEKKLSKLQRK